jgi:DNA-binding XRE family transcriptional regulator
MQTRIQDARLEADMTQAQLAAEARVSVFTIIRAEKGNRISALNQTRIARVLGIPRQQLFNNEVAS